jgi:hypothetical protein
MDIIEMQGDIDKSYMKMREAEIALNAIDSQQYQKELKNESDYRAYFVKRITGEIATETAKKNSNLKAWETAQIDAAIVWLTERLNEQKELASRALGEYTNYSEEVTFYQKRNEEQFALEIEQSQLSLVYNQLQGDQLYINTLHNELNVMEGDKKREKAQTEIEKA